jgi:hypothetical protein
MGAAMRSDDGVCGSLFSYIDLEKQVRADHPLRVIRQIANAALQSLSGEFAKLYSTIGRESIPPERLMRVLLLQAFYSIRSERQLVERIDYDLLFRWFVGLRIEDAVCDATTFTKNATGCWTARWQASSWPRCCRKTRSSACCRASTFRLMAHCWKPGRARRASARRTALTSRPARVVMARGERGKNDTHVSTADPDARLYRKGPGKEVRLCFMGHALMENRNGLIVGAVTTRASGHAERLAALTLIEPHADRPQLITPRRRQRVRRQRLRHGTARESRDPARGAEPEWAPLGNRRPHYSPFRPRGLPAHSETHRGGFRLGQDGGRLAQDAASRAAQSRLAIHSCHGRLRSCPIVQIARSASSVTWFAGRIGIPVNFRHAADHPSTYFSRH